MEFTDENVPPLNNSWWTKNQNVPENTNPCSPVNQRTVLAAISPHTADLRVAVERGTTPPEDGKCQISSSGTEEALDAEAWSERTAVITKYEHEEYCQIARDIVADIVDRVSDDCLAKAAAAPLQLPDLVAGVSSQNWRGTDEPHTQTDDSEYESADEVHDTVYLDSTNGVAEAGDVSTPNGSVNDKFDFDSTVVLDAADVTVTVAESPVAAKSQLPPRSIVDAARLLSPSSCSDVSAADSEGVKLEQQEVDVDLISQFERLALTKGLLGHSDAASVVDCAAAVTDSGPDSQALADSELVGGRISEQSAEQVAAAPPVVEDCVEEEAAESAPELGQVAQEAFVEPVTEDATVEQVADVVDAPGEIAVEAEDFGGVTGSIAGDILPAVQEVAPRVAGFAAEEPVQAEVGAEEVGPIVESPEEFAVEGIVPGEEPVGEGFVGGALHDTAELVGEEVVAPVVEECYLLNSTCEIPSAASEETARPEIEVVAPPAGVDFVAEEAVVDTADSVAHSTFQIESAFDEALPEPAPVDIVTEQVSPVIDSFSPAGSSLDQAPSEPTPTDVVVEQVTHPCDPVGSSADQGRQEESTSPTNETFSEPIEEPTTVGVTEATGGTVADPLDVLPATGRGYDLSCLDRIDNVENALPVDQHPASLESTAQVEPAAHCSAEPERCEPEPARPDCGEEGSPREETTPRQSCSVSPSSREEEAVLVPKKGGYDLSFLDQVEDLQNISPQAIAKIKTPVKASPKRNSPPTAKGNRSDMKEKDEPAPDQVCVSALADGGGGDNDAVSSVGAPEKTDAVKKVRKPIRPRIARPVGAAVKKDPFQVEFAFDPDQDPFATRNKLAAPSAVDSTPADNSATKRPMTVNEDQVAPDAVFTDNNNAENDALSQSVDKQHEEFRPAGEVFQDACDLDFLMQHGCGSSKEIALARQSLFVKFDPLVGGRASLLTSGSAGSQSSVNEETMVVEEGHKSTASESLFLFSPPNKQQQHQPQAQQHAVVHNEAAAELYSVNDITGPCSLLSLVDPLGSGHFVSDDMISMNEHRELVKVQELLFQDKLLQKEREIQTKEKELAVFKGKLDATAEAQSQMRQIVGEYEKTISQLIAEKEREKAGMEATLQATIKERDQAIEDVKEVERAFSEFHRMYERNRAAAESLHKNEETLKKAMAAYQERLQQEQHKYETLKQHAAQKLEAAQQEMENMKRNLEAESSRIKAVLKKTEMRLSSVEMSLDQKTKENEELTKLCDELINKLGSSGGR